MDCHAEFMFVAYYLFQAVWIDQLDRCPLVVVAEDARQATTPGKPQVVGRVGVNLPAFNDFPDLVFPPVVDGSPVINMAVQATTACIGAM